MTATDPRAYVGLLPAFRNQVERWIAAGQGEFWLPVGGGLRSRQRQEELRIINGCPDIYTSPASSCRVPTAIPGSSRHETGEAVDIQGNLTRAKELAPAFGLTDIPRERWHFQAVGGRSSQPAPPRTPGEVFAEEGVLGDYSNTVPGNGDCLVSIPSIGLPFGSLPIIPDKIGGQCFFYKSWGRAILGGALLAAGTLVAVVGIGMLAGREITVPKIAGSQPDAPTAEQRAAERARLKAQEMLNRPVRVYERTITSKFSPYEPPVVETTRATTRFVAPPPPVPTTGGKSK